MCTRTTWRWWISSAIRRSARTWCRWTTCRNRERARFMGFVREDGRVGTRNFIGILSSVNCSATVIRNIAAHFTPERLAAFPNVDGVAAFAQTSGCGMSSPSEHFDVLRRTLAGYARHANLAGVLIVGLGCERNQVASLVESQGLATGRLMRTLVMQEVGGTRETIQAGIEAVEAMLPLANASQRQSVSRQPHQDRAGVRRLGRLFRHHRQSGAGRGDGHPGAPRRHRHPVGNAGDPRRRIHADAARGDARGRTEIAGPAGLVGELHARPQRPVQRRGRPRQPGRRAGQHLREVAGLGDEGRHHAAAGGVRIRRTDRQQPAWCSWIRRATTRWR